jgi:hypothetical protein
MRLATNDFPSRCTKPPTSSNESDGNPSAADIRQRSVTYGLRFVEILPYELQLPE